MYFFSTVTLKGEKKSFYSYQSNQQVVWFRKWITMEHESMSWKKNASQILYFTPFYMRKLLSSELKHEFIVCNYHKIGCFIFFKKSSEMPMIKLDLISKFRVSPWLLTSTWKMKNPEKHCILSRSIELLSANKILLGTILCKTTGKTALLGLLMGN